MAKKKSIIALPQRKSFLISSLKREMVEKKLLIVTAESITGGGIAQLLTSIDGSSEYFLGSVVAYSEKVKKSFLKVKPETMKKYSVYSKECVTEMCNGVLTLFSKFVSSDSLIALSISGIAGPTGGTDAIPVGTVFIAVKTPAMKKPLAKKFFFTGNRDKIRRQSALSAIIFLLDALKAEGKIDG